MSTETQKVDVLADEVIERACRAHWPSYDRMRPDIARKWKAKMTKALVAAGLIEAKVALEWCGGFAYAGGRRFQDVEPVKAALAMLGSVP